MSQSQSRKPAGQKAPASGSATPEGSGKGDKSGKLAAQDQHDHFVRQDVVARLRSIVGSASTAAPAGRGARPILLSLDPVLLAYFEDEVKRRNKLVKSGRYGAKVSVHSLLLDALRVRLSEMDLYRSSAVMVARRRDALGSVPVTVRVPMALHQGLEKVAMAVPREEGGRAMYVKTVSEGLALAWATSVNIENLFSIEEPHAKRAASRPAGPAGRSSGPARRPGR